MKIGGQRIPGKTILLIISESVLIGLGLLFATALRFLDAQAIRDQLRQPDVVLRYGLVVLVCELTLYYCDLYDLQIVSRRSVLFVRLLQALGSACLILALLYFWDPELSLGRGIAAIAAPVIITLVVGWRLLVDTSAPLMRRNERILIVGDGPAGRSVAEDLMKRPELNLKVVGFLSEFEEPISRPGDTETSTSRFYNLRTTVDRQYRRAPLLTQFAAAPLAGAGVVAFATAEGPAAVASNIAVVDTPAEENKWPPVIGNVSAVEKVAISEHIDRIVLSFGERRGGMPIPELLRLKFLGFRIEEAHNMYERNTGRILLDHLSPSWLILSDGFQKSALVLGSKRALDLFVSAFALLITTPILAALAFAIWAEDGTPVLFRQERVGLGGKHFQILKFRSMRKEPTPGKASWTSDEDPRITRVGKFIRKFRLDELPQLINVLRGNMSLVGPRPEQPFLAQMLEQELPYYSQRHTMRPGITGWAQVKYGYGATVEETKIKLEHDLFYIKHLSTALDLAIMFETGKVLLTGRGAK